MKQSRPSNPLPFALRCILFLIIVGAVSAAHAQTLTTLFAFNGTDGAEPFQSNLLDIGGTLYGTTGYRRRPTTPEPSSSSTTPAKKP